jgi:hypothetical protein
MTWKAYKVSHRLFSNFKTLFLVLLEISVLVEKLDFASKGTFFIMHITVQIKLGLKIGDIKEKCHTGRRGGSEKRQKRLVKYYLNGPLRGRP